MTSLAMTFLGRDVTSDAGHDWVLLRAGWQGLDVSRPVYELAGDIGQPGVYTTLSVARPPGFFIAYAPLLPSTQSFLEVATAMASAAGLALIVHVTQRTGRLRLWSTLAVAGICLGISTTFLRSNNPAFIWAGLVIMTWVGLERRWAWGIPLGVAAAVRLWPGLAIAILLARRREAGIGAALTMGLLTVLGLFVVSPDTAVAGIVAGTRDWLDAHPQNLSLSAALFAVGVPIPITILLGSLLVLAVTRTGDLNHGFGLALAAGMLLSPIAWPAYLTATAPLWPSTKAIMHSIRGARRANRPQGP
jgi:hypothetical protein